MERSDEQKGAEEVAGWPNWMNGEMGNTEDGSGFKGRL